ncbi:MAG: histidine phosphatase family protein [Alcanivorax nanhaiticus]
MAQFYLVRHGQASFGSDNYDQLSPLGHQQARWLGEYFAERDMQFDGLMTGDLVRHQETGAGICEGLGIMLPSEIHSGLNEFDFHAIVHAWLAQHPEAEAKEDGANPSTFYKALKAAMKAWRHGELQGDLPESWEGFSDRVAAARDHLQQHYSDKDKVVIVSSGGAMGMFMKHALNTADDTVVELNLQIRNTSLIHGFDAITYF